MATPQDLAASGQLKNQECRIIIRFECSNIVPPRPEKGLDCWGVGKVSEDLSFGPACRPPEIPVKNTAEESSTIRPRPGIPPMMKAPQHHEFVAVNKKEEGVGESTKDSLSHLTVDGGECFGEPQDPGGCSVNGSGEFGTQAFCPFLVPGTGLEDIQASLRAELQAHRPQP